MVWLYAINQSQSQTEQKLSTHYYKMSSESEIISQDFLEKLLGKKVKSFTIKAHADTGDNFMSIIYTLEVNLLESHKPLYLFTKCYPTNPGRQEFLNSQNIFWKELNFYTSWMPELTKFQEDLGLEEIVKPDFPIFVAGESVNFNDKKEEQNNNGEIQQKVYKSWDNFIMMVDLDKTGGFKMADRHLGLDRDHALLVVEAQAKIHALSWAYKQAKSVEKIKDNFPFLHFDFTSENDKKMFQQMIEANVDVAAGAVKSTLGKDSHLITAIKNFAPKANRVTDIMFGYDNCGETEKDLVKYLRVQPTEGSRPEKEISWTAVIHGDSHLNNMLFRYNSETKKPEQVVLVDLQLCREANPIADLIYIVYTSSNSEFRKNHLEEILKVYFEKFNHFCQLLKCETLPGFTLEELKYRFHRMKPFGLTMALITTPIFLKEKTDAVQLDSLEGLSQEEIFVSLAQGMDKSTRYNKQMTELLQELEAEGVI